MLSGGSQAILGILCGLEIRVYICHGGAFTHQKASVPPRGTSGVVQALLEMSPVRKSGRPSAPLDQKAPGTEQVCCLQPCPPVPCHPTPPSLATSALTPQTYCPGWKVASALPHHPAPPRTHSGPDILDRVSGPPHCSAGLAPDPSGRVRRDSCSLPDLDVSTHDPPHCSGTQGRGRSSWVSPLLLALCE